MVCRHGDRHRHEMRANMPCEQRSSAEIIHSWSCFQDSARLGAVGGAAPHGRCPSPRGRVLVLRRPPRVRV